MEQVRSKTFRSGNSLAVRLPKGIAFAEGTEVNIVRKGDVVTITPVKKSVAWMIEQLRTLPLPSEPMVVERIEFPDRVWDR